MTTSHDAPRLVYLGGKMVQAKPDAPDHDSSPLYVLARDHAALVERCRVLEEALSDMVSVAAQDGWDKAMTGRQLILKSARAALASGGRG